MPTAAPDTYRYTTVDMVYHWCQRCRLFSQHNIMLADIAKKHVSSGRQRSNYRIVCLLCNDANPAMDSF